MVEQGDILKIEGIEYMVLVVSKNRFNESGHVIVCPIISEETSATLAFPIDQGMTVLCDNLRQLDLKARVHSVKGRISMVQLIHIIDRIQSMFDYF